MRPIPTALSLALCLSLVATATSSAAPVVSATAPSIAATSASTAARAAPRAAYPVGVTRFTMNLPSAAFRRTDGQPALDVVVWYPAAPGTAEQPQPIGLPDHPILEGAPVAPEAPPAAGPRRPVILLSHAYGENTASASWLGAGLARAGFVVVGVEHPGNNTYDNTVAGAVAWWERPKDLVAALAGVNKDPQLSALIDPADVGVAGFSMGGITALVLGGARLDPLRYDAFCASDTASGLCRARPELLGVTPGVTDRVSAIRELGLGPAQAAAIRGEGTALPGVKAVLSIAAPASMLSPASLADVRVPTVIVAGADDRLVPPAANARVLARGVPGAELVIVPGATHYSFIGTCTDMARKSFGICRQATEQERAHRVALDAALRLFGQALGVPA